MPEINTGHQQINIFNIRRNKMKIEIKSKFDASVIFSHDCENNSLATTLAIAVKAGADLTGADLTWADLSGVDL